MGKSFLQVFGAVLLAFLVIVLAGFTLVGGIAYMVIHFLAA